MPPGFPLPRALPRPRRAALAVTATALLAIAGRSRTSGEEAPSAPAPRPAAAGELAFGTPVPPAAPTDAEEGVGLLALDARAGTVAALRTDGRLLVRAAGSERVFEPPADAGAFRVFAVADDGVPVVVTTHGRVVLLEPGGARLLDLAVQRSAKPAAIPGSKDVVLGSESGAIRRLVRGDGAPRLCDVVPSGDAPVGALAAAADRVVYARLDGVVLEAAFAGGEPRELARPSCSVRAVRVVGASVWLLERGELVAGGEAPPPATTDAREVALSKDGALAALLVGDALEVRRLADGARVATKALASRTPTGLAFDDEGRALLVATSADARPWRVPLEPRPPTPRPPTPR